MKTVIDDTIQSLEFSNLTREPKEFDEKTINSWGLPAKILKSESGYTVCLTDIDGNKITYHESGMNLEGIPLNRNEWRRRIAARQANLMDAKNAEDLVRREAFAYKDEQKGTANKDNFFWRTDAVFTKISRRPGRKPDFVSRGRDGRVSSEYWYTQNGVIRGSNHWGVGVASCNWAIKGISMSVEKVTKTNKLYAGADWNDFIQQPAIIRDADRNIIGITNFDNTVGRKTVVINGETWERDSSDKWVNVEKLFLQETEEQQPKFENEGVGMGSKTTEQLAEAMQKAYGIDL